MRFASRVGILDLAKFQLPSPGAFVMVTKERTASLNAPCNEGELVKVDLSKLQSGLNKIFARQNRKELNKIYQDDFDYLWDLKELAILEKKQIVEVPGTWLSEMDNALASLDERSHTH